MDALFWGCLSGGIVFTVVTVLLGDVLDGIFDMISLDFLNSTVIAATVTTFGGAGIMLSHYTPLESGAVIACAAVISIVMSIIVYFAYIKPMERSENSTGFSMKELAGQLGEVTIPIPSQGFGEVMIKLVAGNTVHIASSWDVIDIQAGTLVVVIDVKEGILQVAELEQKKGDDWIGNT